MEAIIATFLYSRRKRDIENKLITIKEEKITPWLLYFNTGKDYEISTSDGRSLIIPGQGDFRAKIQDTFWDFIEPILENEIVTVLKEAQEDVRTFRRGFQRKHLDETRYLLQEKLVRGVYDDMVMVDQKLRGKGSPKKVLLRNIEEKLDKFDKFVVGQVKATQKLLNRTHRAHYWFYLLFFVVGALTMLIFIILDQLISAGVL